MVSGGYGYDRAYNLATVSQGAQLTKASLQSYRFCSSFIVIGASARRGLGFRVYDLAFRVELLGSEGVVKGPRQKSTQKWLQNQGGKKAWDITAAKKARLAAIITAAV